MLSHLFKLLWNKKKQNLLLIIEIFVSFFVLFIIVSFLSYAYDNYKKPIGFNPDNIKVVRIELNGNHHIFSDSIVPYHEAIDNVLKSIPEIKSHCFSDFVMPYSMGSRSEHINLKLNKNTIHSEIYYTTNEYLNVLGQSLKEGRWFDKTENDTTKRSAVINEEFKMKYFPNEDPIGKEFTIVDEKKWKIVGVVNNIKDRGDYLNPSPNIYLHMDNNMEKASVNILLNVTTDASADFDNRLSKTLSNVVKSGSFDIKALNEERKTKNLILLVPTIVFIIISGFLILNVCLGLFGVLWYNINKRKAEIGLRKALGATSFSIKSQFVYEAMVLATMAILFGLFFVLQFPLLRVFDLDPIIYIKGIISSIIFIYFIVLLCAIYPSWQAASVYPAQVLHEE